MNYASSRFALVFVLLAWFGLVCGVQLRAAEPSEEVVVLYNRKMPQSKSVADHYVKQRQIPADRVIGVRLPEAEAISRKDYQNLLEQPFLRELKKRKLIVLGGARPLVGGKGAGNLRCRVRSAAFRYVVLCYGVPTRIKEDSSMKESAEGLHKNLARNEAAVDSELACLPLAGYRRLGPLSNPFYAATNAALLHPTNGVLLVSRVDGPDSNIARGLVDKALLAESYGLWGRAYFDLRGITEGGYVLGDRWIGDAASVCQQAGFEVDVDRKSGTIPAGYPMSHVAFYAGWYDAEVSGPFSRKEVEFMPGALAYHLHSFSADVVRSRTRRWVGPLLNAGATATLGCVSEPYLRGTPNVSMLFDRFIRAGFSFAEAAFVSQGSISWQVLALGDPVYRPFSKTTRERHLELLNSNSPVVVWSHLRSIELGLTMGVEPAQLLQYALSIPERTTSPVVMEKIADLYLKVGNVSKALETFDNALASKPSKQQSIGLMFRLGEVAAQSGEARRALNTYQSFLQEQQDYPDKLRVYRKMLPLAKQLKESDTVAICEREIERLSKGG